jgi:hypothetical protein
MFGQLRGNKKDKRGGSCLVGERLEEITLNLNKRLVRNKYSSRKM